MSRQDSISVKFKYDDQFLDRESVRKRIGVKITRNLNRAGARLRLIARRSIKRRQWTNIKRKIGAQYHPMTRRQARAYENRYKGGGKLTKSGARYVHEFLDIRTTVSRPGRPPYAHTSGDEFGIKWIQYGYEPALDRVIVGPVGSVGRSGKLGDVPSALEFGGTTTMVVPEWARKKRRSLWGTRTITKRIRKRPFMRPALKVFKAEYAKSYANLLKK